MIRGLIQQHNTCYFRLCGMKYKIGFENFNFNFIIVIELTYNFN